jgi:uncharacterized protein YoxC
MNNVNGIDREITWLKETLREHEGYMKYVLGLLREHEEYMKKVIVLDKDIKGIKETLNEHEEYIKHFHTMINPQNSPNASSKSRNRKSNKSKKYNKNNTNKLNTLIVPKSPPYAPNSPREFIPSSPLYIPPRSPSRSNRLNEVLGRPLSPNFSEDMELILIDGIEHTLVGKSIFDEDGTFVGVLNNDEVIWKTNHA